jgi:hypothetical protein
MILSNLLHVALTAGALVSEGMQVVIDEVWGEQFVERL